MIDAHLHLHDVRENTVRLLESADDCGVELFFANAALQDDWRDIRDLADLHYRIVPFYGIHPWYIQRSSADWLRELETLLAHNPGGIGEIGLDRSSRGGDFGVQLQFFKTQLRVAKRFKRPVVLHCTRAWGSLCDILESERLEVPVMAHSFSGSSEIMQRLIGIGVYFSYSPRTFCGEEDNVSHLISQTPHDRLLLESDHPFLPIGSGYYFETLREVYTFSGNILGLTFEETERLVRKNAKTFVDATAFRKNVIKSAFDDGVYD